jgi:hypothetical protein
MKYKIMVVGEDETLAGSIDLNTEKDELEICEIITTAFDDEADLAKCDICLSWVDSGLIEYVNNRLRCEECRTTVTE